MPISLEIVDEKGSTLYSDAAFIKTNPTIAEFGTYLTTVPYDKTWPDGKPIFYVPSYFNISSIKITNIATGAPAVVEETDRILRFSFDKYIVRVDVKRKPRGARKTKNISGGRRSKTLRSRK